MLRGGSIAMGASAAALLLLLAALTAPVAGSVLRGSGGGGGAVKVTTVVLAMMALVVLAVCVSLKGGGSAGEIEPFVTPSDPVPAPTLAAREHLSLRGDCRLWASAFEEESLPREASSATWRDMSRHGHHLKFCKDRPRTDPANGLQMYGTMLTGPQSVDLDMNGDFVVLLYVRFGQECPDDQPLLTLFANVPSNLGLRLRYRNPPSDGGAPRMDVDHAFDGPNGTSPWQVPLGNALGGYQLLALCRKADTLSAWLAGSEVPQSSLVLRTPTPRPDLLFSNAAMEINGDRELHMHLGLVAFFCGPGSSDLGSSAELARIHTEVETARISTTDAFRAMAAKFAAAEASLQRQKESCPWKGDAATLCVNQCRAVVDWTTSEARSWTDPNMDSDCLDAMAEQCAKGSTSEMCASLDVDTEATADASDDAEGGAYVLATCPTSSRRAAAAAPNGRTWGEWWAEKTRGSFLLRRGDDGDDSSSSCDDHDERGARTTGLVRNFKTERMTQAAATRRDGAAWKRAKAAMRDVTDMDKAKP
jgi:hypothetical protein